MQIGVVSDTHGYADPAFTELFRDVSCIIHAGDIGTSEVLEALSAIAPVHAVRGNVDHDPKLLILPEQLQLNLDGLRLLVVHRLQDAHPEPDTQVVVSGHSHRAVVEERDRILYLNPGAAGRQGFHRERTAALLIAEDPPVARLLSLGPKSREGQVFAARPVRTQERIRRRVH
jgi:putative phosphoesterase